MQRTTTRVSPLASTSSPEVQASPCAVCAEVARPTTSTVRAAPTARVDVGVGRVPGALLRAGRHHVAHVHVDRHLQHREQQRHDQHRDQHEVDDGAAPLAVVRRDRPLSHALVTELSAFVTASTIAVRNGTRMASTRAAVITVIITQPGTSPRSGSSPRTRVGERGQCGGQVRVGAHRSSFLVGPPAHCASETMLISPGNRANPEGSKGGLP